MKLAMPNNLIGKFQDGLYKNKPTIYVVAGMVGTAVSVYLAWRAGKQTKEVIEEVKYDIAEVREKRPEQQFYDEETGEVTTVPNENGLSQREYNLALTKVYMTAMYKLGKVFAPAVLTEAASLTAIGVGYGILNERHLATVEAANMYARMLNKYRSRVREQLGDEKEKELYYGTKEKEIEEPELNEKGEPKLTREGKPKVRKSKRQVLEEELSKHSMYARVFDPQNCKEFEYDAKTLEEDVFYNNMSIRQRAQMLTNNMYYRPYHKWTLNEVYREYGFSERSYGQVMGWHCAGIDPNTKKFIFDGDPEGIRVELFPVWYEDDDGKLVKTYIIDFNVSENILGYYPEKDILD